MPIKRCQSGGQPGWKFGDAGKCYPYVKGDKNSSLSAKKKAIKQAIAMGEKP
jgi:hypothetical protein